MAYMVLAPTRSLLSWDPSSTTGSVLDQQADAIDAITHNFGGHLDGSPGEGIHHQTD